MSEATMFARYKEAAIRADETISALQTVIAAQRQVIDLLHAKIGQLERQMDELRAAL